MGGRGSRRYFFPTIGVAGGNNGISQRIQTVAPSNLIALWPLNETSGAAVVCTNNSALSVATGHVGVTLAQPGPYSTVCPLYDGANDVSSLFSAGLASAFSGPGGTLLLLGKVYNAAVWADTTVRYAIRFSSNADNIVYIYKSATANRITFVYKSGSVSQLVNVTVSSVGFVLYALTWNKSGDQVIAYVNNAQSGTTQTGLGVWSGSLADAFVGSSALTPTGVWNGWLSCASLYNRALTLPEIQYIYGGGPG